MSKRLPALLFLLLFLTPSFLFAEEVDPVIQTIEKAMEEYDRQDFTNAANSLDYASQLIRQKKGEALAKLLPEPLAGWSASESSSQVTTASLFGGGLSAERSYNREEATVKISIVTDSPLLQSVTMLFSNPLFASSAGQFELINGHKGIVNYKNGGGDINIVVNNRYLVTLNGKNLSRDELLGYARAIDLDGIAALP